MRRDPLGHAAPRLRSLPPASYRQRDPGGQCDMHASIMNSWSRARTGLHDDPLLVDAKLRCSRQRKRLDVAVLSRTSWQPQRTASDELLDDRLAEEVRVVCTGSSEPHAQPVLRRRLDAATQLELGS